MKKTRKTRKTLGHVSRDRDVSNSPTYTTDQTTFQQLNLTMREHLSAVKTISPFSCLIILYYTMKLLYHVLAYFIGFIYVGDLITDWKDNIRSSLEGKLR